MAEDLVRMIEPMECHSLVAGTYMDRSLGDFMRACEAWIAEEQYKLAPDTHLIALLCDSVRLAREFIRSIKMTELPSALKTLRLDASRYRYLRSYTHPTSPSMDGTMFWNVAGHALPLKAASFDAAVDLARQRMADEQALGKETLDATPGGS